MSFQERTEARRGSIKAMGEFLRRLGRDAQIMWAVNKAYYGVKPEERKDFLTISIPPRLGKVEFDDLLIARDSIHRLRFPGKQARTPEAREASKHYAASVFGEADKFGIQIFFSAEAFNRFREEQFRTLEQERLRTRLELHKN